ncbi:hypothetical protein MHY30_14860 [Microbacterium sp. ACRRU]|uniref:hypothetical protein n=1 Tax=Microbacterium sp. ACRRU TaxID=2918204 RepID=UPI001EF4D79A|nr:hypothetical protein [Microbacterium sp. ACRRU]MCG7418785.1 hypothetical protein [Microbacterium sp. ACRRU]
MSPARLIGFLLVPILSAVAPLIVIPVITGSFGGEAWAAVAVAQSVGSAAAVIVELGWGLNGPQRVARARGQVRSQLYLLSLVTKGIVVVLLVAPVMVTMQILAPTEVGNAQIVAVGYLITGLSPVWFFIGEGRPLRILLFDAMPRLIAAVIPAILIVVFDFGLEAYAAGLLVGGLVPPLLGLTTARPPRNFVRRFGLRRLVRAIRAQGGALGGRAASALYIALPITLVGIAAPAALVLFSAVERMMRLGLALLASIPNSLQSWVGAPPATAHVERRRRVQLALVFNAVLGLIAGLGFTWVAPSAARILFSGTTEVDHSIAALAGLVIFITCTSRATGGLGLVAYRRVPAIAVSAVVGACVGVPAILVFASYGGVAGAYAAEILAELCVLAVQVAALARAGVFRRSRG